MKLAVIGAGISGLSAAWMALKAGHDVTLYEQNTRAGGHARTISVDSEVGPIDVDTGFIVFNARNYPNLMAFFEALGVGYHDSDMSFAASFADGFEYSSKSLRGMFPTFKTLFDKRRYQIARDYKRFANFARAFLRDEQRLQSSAATPMSLRELLVQSGVSREFSTRFLLPIGGAIWSATPDAMRDFPARSFVQFFENHGLLDYHGQPQWFTVTGGSKRYVDAALADCESMGGSVKLSSRKLKVARKKDGVHVIGESEKAIYDHVILAAHADESLAMMENPSDDERDILSAFSFQNNIAYLHSDTSFMPQNKHCWASWVYRETDEKEGYKPQGIPITYWMNLLQGIDARVPLFVTLNPDTPPEQSLTHDIAQFTHPVFDDETVAAQARLAEINGINRISYVGAWQRYGFHEDGIASSVAALSHLDIKAPWATDD